MHLARGNAVEHLKRVRHVVISSAGNKLRAFLARNEILRHQCELRLGNMTGVLLRCLAYIGLHSDNMRLWHKRSLRDSVPNISLIDAIGHPLDAVAATDVIVIVVAHLPLRVICDLQTRSRQIDFHGHTVGPSLLIALRTRGVAVFSVENLAVLNW